jgi:hypothetical protein
MPHAVVEILEIIDVDEEYADTLAGGGARSCLSSHENTLGETLVDRHLARSGDRGPLAVEFALYMRRDRRRAFQGVLNNE